MKIKFLYGIWLLLFVGILSYFATDNQFNNYEWLAKDHPIRINQEYSDRVFLGGESLLVAVILPEEYFQEKYISDLRKITRLVKDQIPKASISTPLNRSFAYGTDNDISFISYDEALSKEGYTIKNYQTDFLSSHHYGQLLSNDQKTFLITIQQNINGDTNQRNNIIEKVRASLDLSRYLSHYKLAGDMQLNQQLNESSIDNLKLLTPMILSIVLFLLLWFYRRWQEPVIIMSNCFIALLVSLNMNLVLGYEISAISLSLPIVMVVIATADSIFILNHWRVLYDLEPKRRLIACLKHLWLPCFYVSITTAIGFGSFAFSEILPLHQYGVLSLITITLCSFIMVLNATIGAYALYPNPKKYIESTVLNDRSLLRFNPRILMYGVVVVFVASLIGLKNYHTETNFLQVFFSQEADLSKAFKLVDEELAGSGQIQIIIKGESPEQFKDINQFNKINNIVHELTKIPESKYVNSYIKPVTTIHTAFNYKKSLPQTNAELAQNLLFLEFSRSEQNEGILQKYVNFDYTVARINLQTANLNSSAVKNLVSKIKLIVQKEYDDYLITGPSFYSQTLSGFVVDTQYQSFLITAFVNLIIFLFHFNLVSALIGFFVTIFPIVVVVGIICWLRIPFDFSTVLIGSISEGLVVDMIIHYLFYQKINKLTIEQTSQRLKGPITWTMIFLGAGFVLFVLSDLVMLQRFGIFNTIAIAISLFTALIILPAMLKIFKVKNV